MTREQAKNNLINIGIAEPTDEQITSYLNQVNGETKKEKDRADRYKNDAEQHASDKADLQKQLDDFNAQNMSELELANKRAEEAEKRAAEAEEKQKELSKAKLISDITSVFVENGLSGELYTEVIKGFANVEDAELAVKNATTFASGVSAKTKADIESAKASWEKEILERTQNPGGGSGSVKKDEEQSAAAEYAKAYSERMSKSTNNASSDNAPVNF